MTALHDETRARWGAYPPEQFIHVVLHGVLHHQLELTSVVVHVYTQIVHQFPGSSTLRVAPGGGKDPTRLRDLFLNMRACLSDAQMATGDKTLLLPYSPERYILDTVREVRPYIQAAERWARLIEADVQVSSAKLPGTRGKSFSEIAGEILKHLGDVTQVLDFAQGYGERIQVVSWS